MPDGMQALSFETRPPLAFVPRRHRLVNTLADLPELRRPFQAYTIELPHNDLTDFPQPFDRLHRPGDCLNVAAPHDRGAAEQLVSARLLSTASQVVGYMRPDFRGLDLPERARRPMSADVPSLRSLGHDQRDPVLMTAQRGVSPPAIDLPRSAWEDEHSLGHGLGLAGV